MKDHPTRIVAAPRTVRCCTQHPAQAATQATPQVRPATETDPSPRPAVPAPAAAR